ncbi:hypothetical protein OAS86_05795 [Gammaproteobacteria bacterium]|nr:hypothetical protein [Gammaproteobacteria bacterium]
MTNYAEERKSKNGAKKIGGNYVSCAISDIAAMGWSLLCSIGFFVFALVNQNHPLIGFAGVVLGLLCIAMLCALRSRQLSNDIQIVLTAAFIYLVLILMGLWWTYFLARVGDADNFKSDVFRGVFRYSPVYGKPDITWHWGKTAISSSVLVASGLIWITLNKPSSTTNKIAAIVVISLPFIFALSDVGNRAENSTTQRLSQPFVHQERFFIEAKRYTSASDVLRTYVEKSSGAHPLAAHYPPGLVLLAKAEKAMPGSYKTTIYISSFIISIIVYLLARSFTLPRDIATLASFIYFISPLSLIHVSTAHEPLFAMLTICSILWIAKALGKETLKTRYALLFGLTVALSTFFTYTTIVAVLFIATWLLVYTCLVPKATMRVVNLLATSLAVFGLTYASLWYLFDFNIWSAFKAGSHTHGLPVAHESLPFRGWDTTGRFFVRGIGNFLAYTLSVGAVSCYLWLLALRVLPRASAQLCTPLLRSFIFAAPAALLFLSMSGLFFMETDRIFGMLTPIFAIASACAIYFSGIRQRIKLLTFLLTATFLHVAAFEILFFHYL